MTSRCDLEELRRAISILLEPGQVYEIRTLDRSTTSGYFSDFEQLAQGPTQSSEPNHHTTSRERTCWRTTVRSRDVVGWGNASSYTGLHLKSGS